MAVDLSYRLGWIDDSIVERVLRVHKANLPNAPPEIMTVEQFKDIMAVGTKNPNSGRRRKKSDRRQLYTISLCTSRTALMERNYRRFGQRFDKTSQAATQVSKHRVVNFSKGKIIVCHPPPKAPTSVQEPFVHMSLDTPPRQPVPSPRSADKGKQPMEVPVSPPPLQPLPVAAYPGVGEGSSTHLVEVLYLGIKIKITRESWEQLSSVLSQAAVAAMPGFDLVMLTRSESNLPQEFLRTRVKDLPNEVIEFDRGMYCRAIKHILIRGRVI
ncbi:uncharacterized protein A4U43_C07F27910 [Asparagus officinalis]|uniref:Uncharacterized protein n=1 Tax=Asparagus officinalis TaxID=4686 RepID=A0A5P1EFD4_ASPOF|nr:uncharacterized protein A4U43_C07F27910 [Asparagus officinalis]